MAGWMRARQTKYTAYVTVYLLVIVAVLGAANWLANRHNKSIDATANKQFSLSDQTVKVVKELKQDVTIRNYDRTSQFDTNRDLLDRYKNLSPKLHVEFIDPDKKPQIAKAAGITSYGQIIVDSGAKKEEAKGITEEEITGALIRSLKSGVRNVCFVIGNGEKSPDVTERAGYSETKTSLEKNNYKVRTTSLAGAAAQAPGAAIPLGSAPAAPAKAEIPADCTVVVVAGPKYEYPQVVADAIQSYVNAGGSALIMLDPPLRMGTDDTKDSPALLKVLDSWGVTVNADLVLDTSGIGQFFGMGPEVPLVSSYESHAIGRVMGKTPTAFPLVRSVDVKPGSGAEKLLATTDDSVATKELGSREIRVDPSRDKKGPLSLAAAGTVKAGAKEGRFVVVGSSAWAGNGYVGFRGNSDLFLNMMNWLSSDEDLISIRPKEPEDRRLTLSQRQMRTLFTTSVIGVPLMVIAAGMMVWWKRR